MACRSSPVARARVDPSERRQPENHFGFSGCQFEARIDSLTRTWSSAIRHRDSAARRTWPGHRSKPAARTARDSDRSNGGTAALGPPSASDGVAGIVRPGANRPTGPGRPCRSPTTRTRRRHPSRGAAAAPGADRGPYRTSRPRGHPSRPGGRPSPTPCRRGPETTRSHNPLSPSAEPCTLDSD